MIKSKRNCKAVIAATVMMMNSFEKTYVLSEGTTCSPMSLSGDGGGGYGCTNGWVWYNPGISSSLVSTRNGHWMPVEQGFLDVGLLSSEHNSLGLSWESLHSTPLT